MRKSILLLLVVMTFIFSGCYIFPKEEEVLAPPIKEPEQVTYETIEVKKGNIEKRIRCSGTFVSVSQEDVFYRDRGGRLKEIGVTLGDKVKKGDLIAGIETGSLVNEIKLQEITLKKSQIIYDNIKARFDIEGGGNKSELEMAALDIESNKLRYENLLTELERSKLTAPIDGEVVYLCETKLGEYVNAYQTIVRIADPKRLQLQYSDEHVSKFNTGMKVDLDIENEMFKGEVVMTPQDVPSDANEVLKKSVRVKVDGELPENVYIGSAATFYLTLDKQENVIVLPKQVLNDFLNRKFVNVLKNGIREERDIELGIQTDTEIEVINGLEIGEQVIIR